MNEAATDRASELIRRLGLRPHPEGGHYGEVFRSARTVSPGDGRTPRAGLTSIDFVLARGGFSAWHRVASDEAWHLLEGGPMLLWLAPPGLQAFTRVELAPLDAQCTPRHVVPAHWWQAAEPLGDYAYVGATVGPGFEFADFAFGREDTALRAALAAAAPDLQRLL